jgi:hypothetical protein
MDVSLPKDHISFSQIDMYRRCPRQYYYRYMEDRVMIPKWIMVAGKAGHRTLEYNNTEKMKSGHDEKLSTVIDYLSNSWNEEKEKYEDIAYEKIKPGEVVSTISKSIIKYFTDGIFESEIPTEVEKEFELNFEGVGTKLSGIVDVLYKDSIFDYKFSQKRPTIQKIATGDQLKTYAVSYLAENKILPKRLGYTYLISTKTPQVVLYEIPSISNFVHNFMEDLRESIISISNSVRTGVFPRNPINYSCSPMSCGYWDICRPGQKKLFFDLKEAYERKK